MDLCHCEGYCYPEHLLNPLFCDLLFELSQVLFSYDYVILCGRPFTLVELLKL